MLLLLLYYYYVVVVVVVVKVDIIILVLANKIEEYRGSSMPHLMGDKITMTRIER